MLFHTLEQAYMVAFVFRTCWVIISGFPSPPNSDVDYMIFNVYICDCWCFHTPLNSDMNYRIFNMYIIRELLHVYAHREPWCMVSSEGVL